MIEKPKFKDCYQVEILESDHIFLLREEVYRVLSGASYKQLAPLLNGENTLMDLARLLEGKMSLPAIQFTLNRLEKQGCIVDANGTPTPKQAPFLYAMGVDAATAIPRLNQSQIVVSTLSETAVTPLLSALQREGLTASQEEGGFQIVVVDDYLQEELQAMNQKALQTGRPWMPVKLVGSKSWMGPIFHPGETACWACMAQRIRANRQVESYLLRKTEQPGPLKTSLAAMPATMQVAANLAALEVVKWVVQGHNKRLQNKLLTFDHLAMAMESHTVVRRPQCPACGDPDYGAKPKPVELSDSHKKALGASLRSRYPEETFQLYKHHISPITGVITGLVDVTGKPNGLTYTHVAGHYFPLISDSIYWLRQNLRAHTGGKGTSQIQSKVSAISEAIERYSTIYWGTEATIRGTYESLSPDAIHPHDYLGFSPQQYENREAWNGELNHFSYQVVPLPFDEKREVAWVPVWSLTNERFKYMLASICYYDHPSARHFFNTIDSNGVAAGNSLEEAVLQGFLELVERDSVAIWWYNRVRVPGVALDSFELPYLKALKQFYKKLNREFWVIDISTDLNVPAFAALSRRVDSEIEDIIYGFGAHFSPQAAVMQAVTEMNQSLPAVGARPAEVVEYNYNWPQKDAIDWWQTATVANQPYLLPDTAVGPKRLADYPQLATDSLKENVETCIAIVKEAGLEMLVLDLTRPDIGMNVCRVCVPGLRHFWRRLGPGRLYDVPVKQGWLAQPRAEEEMNPFSIFF